MDSMSNISGSLSCNAGNDSLSSGPGTVTVDTVHILSANSTGGAVSKGWPSQFVVVPESGTLALDGLGIAGVGSLRPARLSALTSM